MKVIKSAYSSLMVFCLQFSYANAIDINAYENDGVIEFNKNIGIYYCKKIGGDKLSTYDALLSTKGNGIELYQSNDIISMYVDKLNDMNSYNEYIIAHPSQWRAIRNHVDGKSTIVKYAYKENVLSLIRDSNGVSTVFNYKCTK